MCFHSTVRENSRVFKLDSQYQFVGALNSPRGDLIGKTVIHATNGNVYIYNAFYLAPGTSISKSGYAKSNWKYLPDQGSVSQPAPVLRVTTAFNAPTTLKKGKSFGLRGIITADVGTITNVTAYVKGANGNAYYYNVNPSCKTWNAQNTINNSFLFGKLSKGNYTYYVSVTATNGGMCTNYTFSRDFKVT